jgi:pyruvate/oxaloacetate carboxyltransferase
MAAATELAAVTAGAEVVHSCANGLGERTGNAALEELMIGLHTLYEFKKIIDRKLPQEHSLMSPDVRMLACVAYKKRLLRNAPPLLFRMKVSHKRYLIPA